MPSITTTLSGLVKTMLKYLRKNRLFAIAIGVAALLTTEVLVNIPTAEARSVCRVVRLRREGNVVRSQVSCPRGTSRRQAQLEANRAAANYAARLRRGRRR